ncbi:MAG TPA: hypothetical protein VE621_04610, partial [Bryobacteraceae bacterium]|nr:hypothetical protein [Bryobacteraceae bacterium]
DQARQAFERTVKQVVSPDKLVESAARDAIMIFGLAGSGVQQGKPVKMKVLTPSPLGAGQLESEMSISVTKVDKAKGEFLVTTVQQYDPKTLQEAAKALMSSMGAAAKNSAAQMPPVDVVDTVEYTMESASGLPKKVVHTRKISTNGNVGRMDRKQIVIKKA